MKKIIALMLGIALLLSLCACGKASTEGEVVVRSVPRAASAENAEEEPTPTPQEPEPTAVPASNAASAYTLTDYVVVKDDNCAFIITGFEENEFVLFMNAVCENYTDKAQVFLIEAASANGIMVNPLLIETVAAGAQADTQMIVDKGTLALYGITTVEELAFSLTVSSKEGYPVDYLLQGEEYVVYPTGLTADTISAYAEREPQAGDIVLLDDETLTFIITGNSTDSYWGYQVHCYIVNKTDKTLVITSKDESVNGKPIETPFIERILPGKRCYTDLYFMPKNLDEIGVTTVTDVTFTLLVHGIDYPENTLTYKP